MTSPSVAGLAEQLLNRLADCECPPNPRKPCRIHKEVNNANRRLIAATLHTVIQATREECAKAICKSCQDGKEAMLLDDDGVAQHLTKKSVAWRHAHEETFWKCKAAALRAQGTP